MDYTEVTETTGTRVTQEALSMLYTRYRMAAAFCEGKDVLEVACGAGQGLGYLATKAGHVVGGDYTEGLLRMAREHYGVRIPLVQLDAHTLPFRDGIFDVVILYEAVYYLRQPDKFFSECRRILRDQGVLLICTVNKEWADFNPSTLSTQYYGVQELDERLGRHGFGVELYGAFPASRKLARDLLLSWVKRLAVRLHLIPKTMKGKEVFKRVFLGTLTPIPPEVTDSIANAHELTPITGDCTVSDYKVIYAVGRAKMEAVSFSDTNGSVDAVPFQIL